MNMLHEFLEKFQEQTDIYGEPVYDIRIESAGEISVYPENGTQMVRVDDQHFLVTQIILFSDSINFYMNERILWTCEYDEIDQYSIDRDIIYILRKKKIIT